MTQGSHLSRRQLQILLHLSSSEEEEDDEQVVQKLNALDDPVLSQKMDQLSTNRNKESLMKDTKAKIETIPAYLTKRDTRFQQMIHHVPSRMRTTIPNNNIEELRQIAILIYKLMVIQTYHLLWTTYLTSGLGQLVISSHEQQPFYSTTIHMWPKEMKALLQLSHVTDENELYLTFVNDQLHELDNQLKQYRAELNIKANNLPGYTITIQKTIETYIEQQIQSFRMKIEHQIELIHYDYHIRALKLEYFRHNPNEYQEQLMKQLCRSKYEQETTEQQYHLLNQQTNYYHSPNQSFECSLIAQSPLIDSIEDAAIRQQLFDQYKEIAVQSRAKLFHLYIKSAEEQRDKYRKKYEDSVKKMWSGYHSMVGNENISRSMIQLINERCNQIRERIKCIYEYKAQSALSYH